MAMSCVLIHKACRTVALPALGAIASPRILVSSFIKAPITELHKEYFSQFSTTASAASDALKQEEQKLIETITKTQFKSSKPFHCCNIQRPEAPPNFPFEIEDDIYELGIKLKREYAGEKIVVNVYNPIYPEYDETHKKKQEIGFSFDKPRVQLKLRITKEDGTNIVVSLWAHVDYVGHPEIYIDSKRVSNEMSYDKDYWREFIQKRGIDDSIGRYMMNYMNWRAAQKHLLFWEKVKGFLNE